MEDLIVCKFGGSSITCKEDVERISKIVSDDSRRKIIVMSAFGKKNETDDKVTDMLIELARSRNPEIVDAVIERHKEVSDKGVDELNKELREAVKANLPEGACFRGYR